MSKYISFSYLCWWKICFVVHPTKPFLRNHTTIVFNTDIWIVDHPTISSWNVKKYVESVSNLKKNICFLSYHKIVYCFGNICYHIYPLQLKFPLWDNHQLWNFKKTKRIFLNLWKKVLIFFVPCQVYL